MRIEHPGDSVREALWTLWQEAFSDPPEVPRQFWRTAYCPRRSLCAVEDGQVLGALYWLDCTCRGQKLAYLYAVATARAHRGRGVCRALMDRAHALLARQGYTGAILVPGEASLASMYAAMGYQPCCGVEEFTCEAGAVPAALQPLRAEAYGQYRRALLPEGGVRQEGENLDWLATMAQLYAGDGFLLAASCQDGMLRCQELLGDPRVAPGILRTLGCARGSFRVPGRERTFAMYRSLDGGIAPAPTYFGLAFD